jgi:hypothetical protein
MSVQSAEFAVAPPPPPPPVPKPVAFGRVDTCSILLTEYNIFLLGFDYNGNGYRVG